MRIKINGIVSIKTTEKDEYSLAAFFKDLADFPMDDEIQYELKGYMTIDQNGEMTLSLSGQANVFVVIPPAKRGEKKRVYWTCTDSRGRYSNYVFETSPKAGDVEDGFSYGEKRERGREWFETVETTKISNKLSKYGGTLLIKSINDDMGRDERVLITSVKIIPQNQA
jgi:hypothetical protein